jgi:hypothetical protein
MGEGRKGLGLSLSALTNPAGGLRYHLRARRYAAELWQPFRWALGEWLLGWQPPENVLALFGPSGGYCLQPFLFERFEQVVCFEPDPLAYAIFKRWLRRAPLERRPRLERISDDHLVLNPERLLARVEALGQPALLFSNVLGQIPMLLAAAKAEPARIEGVREAVRAAILGRSFASFHDRVSGELKPEFEPPLFADGRVSDRELLDVMYRSPEVASVDEAGLLDHATEAYFPSELPCAYFCWELEPQLYHLIEAVRSIEAGDLATSAGGASQHGQQRQGGEGGHSDQARK